jgi:hypothetical protein
MLEETNDNLQEADGNVIISATESNPSENAVIEDAITTEEVREVVDASEDVADATTVVEHENQKP